MTRRGPLIALAVVVALVIVALVVGERLARDYAEKYVRDRLTEAFSLEPGHPMTIDIGDGSILAQAVRGSIDTISATIPAVPLGDIEGDVSLAATVIPLDGTTPLDTLDATVTVDGANVDKLLPYLSGIPAESLTLGDDLVTVGSDIRVLGFGVPISMSLEPSASKGELVFDPTTITIAGRKVEVDDLRSGFFGPIAKQFLPAQTFCAAEYLPQSISLTDIAVDPKKVVLTLNGDGAALGGSDFLTMGSCEG